MVTPCALSRHLIVTILFVAALLTAILAALQFTALEVQDPQAMLDRLPTVLRYEAMRVFPPALLMLLVVHWRFLAPLRRLLRCTAQNDPAPLPVARKDTVGQLAGAFGDLQRRLHQTREELEHHRSWCQLLFDDAPEAILLLDPVSELVLDANAAACRLLVHPREALAGLPLTQLCPDNLSALQGFMRRVRRDRSGWTTELHCRNAVGEVVELEIKAAVVERTGAEVVLTTLRPLTNQAVAQAKVDALAYHDALTGLPNRVLLRDRLDMALARCHRSPGQRGAVLMLDVDNFKTINDPLGHSAGDRLLQDLAGRILKALHPDDTLARLGGDEFVVLPQQMDSETAPVLEHALALVDQVRAILDRPFVIDEHEIHITVSVGIAVYPDDGNSVDELLRRTDSAMYQAKAAGRNKTHFYSPELEEGVARRLTMGTALRRALAEEEFLLHFQPKFALPERRLVGCEALVRWERPGHGLVAPLDFLPYLEEIGLMTELGFWVLDRACQQWREGRTEGRLDANFRMAVNVSAGQFASSAFVQMVLSILQENAMPGCNLELEITEQALVNDLANAAAKITALQAHGVSFAIDDFGTGYSSLAYLQQLPVDCLKIDRGFVTLIGQTARSAGLVDVIIGIARKLNLRVVAEGVEHERQLAYLNEHGCDIGQGYLFGRPMPWQRLLDQTGTVTGSRDRDGFAG